MEQLSTTWDSKKYKAIRTIAFNWNLFNLVIGLFFFAAPEKLINSVYGFSKAYISSFLVGLVLLVLSAVINSFLLKFDKVLGLVLLGIINTVLLLFLGFFEMISDIFFALGSMM